VEIRVYLRTLINTELAKITETKRLNRCGGAFVI